MGTPEEYVNKKMSDTYKKIKKWAKGKKSLGDAADNSTIKNPDQAIPTVKQVAKHTKKRYAKASDINKKGY